jgi:autotransporter-associated beta strand protein
MNTRALRKIPDVRISYALPAFAIAFLLFAHQTLAGNATWNLDPISGDWNTTANWTPETVPGVGDIATFATSNTTDISVSVYTAVGGISFAAGASPFTFTAPPNYVIEIQNRGISNNSAAVQTFIGTVDDEGNAGAIAFTFSTSTAGTNTVFIAEARRASSGNTGDVEFVNGSAASGVFFNNGGEFDGSIGGQLRFFGNATAADATVTNEGGSLSGAGGGTTYFLNMSHAGNATLIANAGSNGGSGGQIIFSNSSTGDTARVQVFGNGTLLLSFRTTGLSIGSLEGDGIANVGGALTVGTNNLSTTFSGLIEDGDSGFGSLTKIGTGTMALASSSTYSGSTAVGAGTLLVTNANGSATGTGTVHVNAGALGGSGIIAGATNIGTGNGSGAFLVPAAGSNVQATLTIQSALTFNADATYTYTFKAKRNRARTDKVIANGVTINSGASIAVSGQTQGALRQGLVLILISNTSANPISGTFSNLPDGGIITINGNNFQASYSGGDGNDLTLTVVP